MPTPALFSPKFVERFVQQGFATADIPQSAADRFREAFQAGAEFFKADSADKMTARLPRDGGYRPFGVEFSASPSRPDEMESFTFSHRSVETQIQLFAQAKTLHGAMCALFASIEPMVEELTLRAADRLKGTSGAVDFTGSFKDWSLLQLNYSRPSSTSADFINDLHEDGCLMTVMTVTGPGLELLVANGTFVPMQPTDRLLFMSGEILNLLSGGTIPAIHHRVRPVRGLAERMSMLFFADMNPAVCKPWLLTPHNISVDIGRRVLTNSSRFGLAEWNNEPNPA